MPCTVYGGAIYNVIYYYLSAKYAGEAGIVFTSIISSLRVLSVGAKDEENYRWEKVL